ncbi:MAG: hypothetical protein ACXWZD_08360 [Actinomycetota bacterium]
MDPAVDAPPTAELLLDLKTPADLALAPDGDRLAFSLHATVRRRGVVRARRPVRDRHGAGSRCGS